MIIAARPEYGIGLESDQATERKVDNCYAAVLCAYIVLSMRKQRRCTAKLGGRPAGCICRSALASGQYPIHRTHGCMRISSCIGSMLWLR